MEDFSEWMQDVMYSGVMEDRLEIQSTYKTKSFTLLSCLRLYSIDFKQMWLDGIDPDYAIEEIKSSS